MSLTKNFTLQEFVCRDGSVPTGSALENVKQLAENLQVLRDELGKPIHINSGFRSVKYNATLQGSSVVSQHLYGRAADIVVEGYTPKQLAAKIEELIAAKKMKQGGIGIYPTFVHYDIRGKRARW